MTAEFPTISLNTRLTRRSRLSKGIRSFEPTHNNLSHRCSRPLTYELLETRLLLTVTPDIVGSNLSSMPNEFESGGHATIRWTSENRGDQRVAQPWFTLVSLLDRTSQNLIYQKLIETNTLFEIGDFRDEELLVELPDFSCSGGITVQIDLDFLDEINESGTTDGENNNRLSADASCVSSSILPVTTGIAEGNEEQTYHTFEISRQPDPSAGFALDGSVDWQVKGTGTRPADESDFPDAKFPSGTALFPSGSATTRISVPVLSDTVHEADEQFLVAVSNPVNVALSGVLTAKGVIVDDDRPAVTISSDRTTLGSGQLAKLTFTLSEAVTDFTAADVLVSRGGALLDFTGEGTTYYAYLSPPSDSINGSIEVVVPAESFANSAAVGNAEVRYSQDFDTARPSVFIQFSETKLLQGETTAVLLYLSEISTDFSREDLSVVGGTITGFSGAGRHYEATIVASGDPDTRIEASVIAGAFRDAAGNENSDSQLTETVAIVSSRPESFVTEVFGATSTADIGFSGGRIMHADARAAPNQWATAHHVYHLSCRTFLVQNGQGTTSTIVDYTNAWQADYRGGTKSQAHASSFFQPCEGFSEIKDVYYAGGAYNKQQGASVDVLFILNPNPWLVNLHDNGDGTFALPLGYGYAVVTDLNVEQDLKFWNWSASFGVKSNVEQGALRMEWYNASELQSTPFGSISRNRLVLLDTTNAGTNWVQFGNIKGSRKVNNDIWAQFRTVEGIGFDLYLDIAMDAPSGVEVLHFTRDTDAQNGFVTIDWKPPRLTGGYALRDYYVEYSCDDGQSWGVAGMTSHTTITAYGFGCVAPGLFRVSAINERSLKGPAAMSSRVNTAPVGLQLSNKSLKENISGLDIGIVSARDKDGDTVSFTVNDARFEVAGGVLKLRENEWLTRADATTVTLEITATDSGTPVGSITGRIAIDVLDNNRAWQNIDRPIDTNGDGIVVPLDALLIINELNNRTTPERFGQLPVFRRASSTLPYLDVNGDGLCTPIDAVLVINHLNRGAGEGEMAPAGSAYWIDSASATAELPPADARARLSDAVANGYACTLSRKSCAGEWRELALDERYVRVTAQRQMKSLPLLADFHTWLEALAPNVLPKNPVREGFDYALRHWTALCRYTEHGALDIDNGEAEWALRGIALDE